MADRPDRLLIVFADSVRNRPFSASYQTLFDVGGGRDVEKLAPIDQATLAGILPDFNAQTLSELDAKNAELSAAKAELKTTTDERDSLQSQLVTITENRDALQSQLAAMTSDRDALQAENSSLAQSNAELLGQVASLQARIDELENPPNPFPNADWAGFRDAALSSPVILRMMANNPGRFIMLVIYMEQIKRDPSKVASFVTVWNQIENSVPLNAQEIAGVNSLAANYKVSLQLNSDGQIEL